MPPSPKPGVMHAITIDPRSWMDRLWSSVADRGRSHADGLRQRAAAAPLDRARALATALLSERGEASGAAVARELLARLAALPQADRLAFYCSLAEGFQPEATRLRAAAQAYIDAPSPQSATQLAEAAEPPRQELLRRMNMAPNGTAALVALRRDLLRHLSGTPALQPLESDLRHLFASWFNRGFLELRRIDWQTPAAVLEKLIAYEAVHEIDGWTDLRRRLAPDRRCFGFFHPALPGEPLIFVEVALTTGLAASVQPLLARDDDEQAQRLRGAAADTAIFYSISNCQEGLRGVSFGNFLIKQVVEELKAELPGLVRFSTLSPVPGFQPWVQRHIAAEDRAELLTADEARALRAAAEAGATVDAPALLQQTLASPAWVQDEAMAAVLGRILPRLCARYLTTVTARMRPSDPVARFHLGNGAKLERLNWLGNRSARGLAESYGIMVNYLYDPDQIEANHEGYVRGLIARSAAVDALLRGKAAKGSASRPAPATVRGQSDGASTDLGVGE